MRSEGGGDDEIAIIGLDLLQYHKLRGFARLCNVT